MRLDNWKNKQTSRIRVCPDRVLMTEDGLAVPYNEAVKTKGKNALNQVRPTIIFIRNDGWSLGAPDRLELVAYQMWVESWVFFIREGDSKLQPIADYKPKE